LRFTAVLGCLIITLVAASTAYAQLVRQFPKKQTPELRLKIINVNLRHVGYICKYGSGKVKWEHCLATKWLKREKVKVIRLIRARSHPYLDSCTRELLSREGGMNPHAYNPSSGAYGGPQALPGEKMRSAGADWRDNIWTQIRWMKGYMNSRYGGSCAALAHSNAYGYY
jgi:hypothetical protein